MQESGRVSKADWLTQGLDVLESEGIRAVRIERLARDLGVAKSGFYWHFSDRNDLLKEMLRYWSEEFTESVLESPKTHQGSPSDRLYSTVEMIEEQNLTKYDLAIRAWAEHDPAALRVVRKVYRRRIDYATELMRDLGFRGQELEMRVQLFICYHSWQRTIFPRMTKAKQRALRKLRCKLFAKK